MKDDGWWMEEAGWWIHSGYNAGIAQESDGKWHVYIGDRDTPGNSARSLRTLKLAKAWVKRHAWRYNDR